MDESKRRFLQTAAATAALGVVPRGSSQNPMPDAAAVAMSLPQNNVVHYNGQPVAVVVADTLERAVAATEAASINGQVCIEA